MPQLDQFTYFTQFFWSCLFAGKEKRAVYALVATVSLALGLLLMDDLLQAVAQFYPATSGGVSGFPPGPSGDSSVFPILETQESQDHPVTSEGERKIKELLQENSLEKTYRNYLIKKEKIIMKVAEILGKRQSNIEPQDIRAGVENFFAGTDDIVNIDYRNNKTQNILKKITTEGERSYYFKKIVEDLQD
jgi:hypothetical protein